MKILITGVAGFIGFHLTSFLLKKGINVVGIDNINDYYNVNLKYARLAELGIYSKDETDFSGGTNRTYNRIEFHKTIESKTFKNYHFCRTNLEDNEFIMQLFKEHKFSHVVNLAAQAGVRYSIENPDVYIQSNINGFLNILEACRNYPVERLIYASSSSVYGANAKIPFSTDDKTDTPVSLYAATKKANELMAHTYSHLYKIKSVGLRFFTVYGPWGRPDMAPMLFADAIFKGKELKVFNNGNMQRDFTYVNDVIQSVYNVIEKKSDIPYAIYNVGNGNPVNLLEFIETLETSFGIKATRNYMPLQMGDVEKTWAETATFDEDFGTFEKTNIQAGVNAFAEWYIKYFNLT